jgi:hypothetical protein
MNSNPLQKYFRQPKLFVALPSKGMFYREGALEGDHSNMPIFGMTGMDEIIMKTPDALFNGEATVKLIESCCPYIKDAHAIPSLDVDTLLTAIRIATYGDQITVSNTCKNCGVENEYEIDIASIIEFYSTKEFNNRIEIKDIIINLRPLSYEEMTKFNTENFKLQRTLYQLNEVTDPGARQTALDEIYAKLAELQVDLFLMSIESVQTPETIVSDKEFIAEWLKNSPKDMYNVVKDRLEQNKEEWDVPKRDVECTDCQTMDQIQISLDQSNFFVYG